MEGLILSERGVAVALGRASNADPGTSPPTYYVERLHQLYTRGTTGRRPGAAQQVCDTEIPKSPGPLYIFTAL